MIYRKKTYKTNQKQKTKKLKEKKYKKNKIYMKEE